MSLGAAAEGAARRTGLPKATCMTLLEAGWALIEDIKEPTRWVHERVAGHATETRAPVPSFASGGIVSGAGPIVGHRPGPGFGPGPSFGAGAIQINVTEDPNAAARRVADEITQNLRDKRERRRS